MAITSESEGTQSATVTTEHTLAAPTSQGKRILLVDTVNMASGDAVELRIKVAVLSAGTQRVVFKTTYVNAQDTDDLIKISEEIPSDSGATFTLKQTTGTGRDFPWKIILIDYDNDSSEPGQGDPPVSTSTKEKIDYLYKAWRNKNEATNSAYKLYADDGSTVDQKATLSDDGTTFTRTEIATGP